MDIFDKIILGIHTPEILRQKTETERKKIITRLTNQIIKKITINNNLGQNETKITKVNKSIDRKQNNILIWKEQYKNTKNENVRQIYTKK